ncbi:MAG: UDP-N-acetylglucosamine 2-epimerase (non-hydrolyzing) [Vicingaceae bacterium]
MKKILTVIGARPQFVKAATVSRAFSKIKGVSEIIVHTGQHFDQNMSEVFFTEMEIPKPDHFLNVNSLGHGAMTGKMMEGLEALMISEKPDAVMVYGDTNSTLAGAITAKKLQIKVAHVEAGLRSFNMHMPEEVNRILTDRISDILYCPTEVARKNLMEEGYGHFNARIAVIGDVMYDAAMYYAEKSHEKSSIIDDLGLKDFALCTLHRAENTDDKEKLASICSALNTIGKDLEIILPLHPRTKKMLAAYGLKLNVRTIEPVGYFDMIALISSSDLVLTDSGGLQKEAYFFKKPCVTMREQTEWVELIEAGVNMLTGSDGDLIVKSVEIMRNKELSFNADLYGDGNASVKIAEDLFASLND